MKKALFLILFSSITMISFEQTKGRDYITMKSDGKVYWMRGGQTIRMMIDVPLKNGSVVNSKGVILAKDGQTVQLKPGDKILMDGTTPGAKK